MGGLMGYEDEMESWYEEQKINIPLNPGSMIFRKRNLKFSLKSICLLKSLIKIAIKRKLIQINQLMMMK